MQEPSGSTKAAAYAITGDIMERYRTAGLPPPNPREIYKGVNRKLKGTFQEVAEQPEVNPTLEGFDDEDTDLTASAADLLTGVDKGKERGVGKK